MRWHPFQWLARHLVPEVRPRETPAPAPPSIPLTQLTEMCNREQVVELAKAEAEWEHAVKANELALMAAARTSHALISAEERSRRMLAGLMDRMDKGTDQ